MRQSTASKHGATAAQAGLRLGERLRQLRVAAGMTQTDLAGERFSKEYVSQIERGKTRPTGETMDLLDRARHLSEGSEFSDLERADVLFRLGVARYKLSSVQTAINLFDEALKLAESTPLPSDHLRSNIFAWRSRCYQRRRDL